MSLRVQYVRCLSEIVEPAIQFLAKAGDPFMRQRIVVPTAGTKAWLQAVLASRLGASGPDRGDGIVANVEIAYPGAIATFLQPTRTAADPWDIDRLTFAVLQALAHDETLVLPFDREATPLLNARRIAGRFDEYHVRRPAMIREWERTPPNPVLSPTANDEVHDGEPVPDRLPAADRWQFDLWRSVRQQIGEPPPPSRRTAAHQADQGPLLVAGLESLAIHQLECLEQLAGVCDVEMLLVHPSPGLERCWAATLPKPTPGLPRRREEPELPDGVDSLVAGWLAGAHDLQILLASQGVAVTAGAAAGPPAANTLLQRLQQTVAVGGLAESKPHDPADRSVVIHRCHSLSRQAEVIHEALLHCFRELDGLQPHDVVIVSPCIEKAAPHLVATFQRTVPGRDAVGHPATIRLPLVVADRGLREVSPGAELLAALLALPGSRCGVDAVLTVAGHPLVRAFLKADDDIAATWANLVDRTEVRWGLDASHRVRRGLAGIPEIHTWKCGLERMLLGAMLPDAAPRAELGGVVPLADVDTADIPAIALLIRIIAVIQRLERAAADRRPVGEWCDTIEETLADLCGRECGDLSEPLTCLRRLRESAAGTAAEAEAVPFDDVRQVLIGWLDDKAGRQPLRTGSITATSMVPLRGVPFRVVCVIGYDDGVVGVSEAEGDDLVARQQLVGDVDVRIDERRALLDCVLAAGDRLVIACTGQNIKTNEPIPLVTPLAELVDFAVRHGVTQADPSKPSGIEVFHPRHHLSPKNFLTGKVQPDVIWGHDAAALEVSARVGGVAEPPPAAAVAASPALPVIELALLEQLADDPLTLHLEETLGINTWRSNERETPATLPLELRNQTIRQCVLELLTVLLADPGGEEAWIEALRGSGRLPFGPHGLAELEEITGLAHGILTTAHDKELPLVGFESRELRIDLPGVRVVGHLTNLHEAAGRLVVVTAGPAERTSYGRPLHAAAVRLLAARAAGLNTEAVSIICRRKEWSPGKTTGKNKPLSPCQVRTIRLDDGVDPGQRLAALADLVRRALATPHGLFGLSEVAVGNRRQKFDEAVRGSWGRSYAHSAEVMVYGRNPVYDDIFPAGSAAVDFLDRYSGCLSLGGKSGAPEYRLT